MRIKYQAERSRYTDWVTKSFEMDKVMEIPGVEFLIDSAGRKKSVLIDLRRHRVLWEDLYGAYVAHKRRNEPRETLVSVKLRLKTKAKRKLRA